MIERLVALHANVNVKSKEGSSLLHIAVQGRSLFNDGNLAQNVLVDLLVGAGAQVNARDAQGNTPLHVADTESEVQQLLNAQADRRIQNIARKTPLQLHQDAAAALTVGVQTLTDELTKLEADLKNVTPGGASQNRLKARIQETKASLAKEAKMLNVEQRIIELLS